MIKLTDRLTMIREGKPAPATLSGAGSQDGRKKTMASEILAAHNRSGDPGRLALRFDSLISHDITYVGIIQTAMASGADHVQATIITKFGTAPLALHLPDLTAQERELILAGSLMNWYAANNTNEGE